jgi:pyridoxine 4-dehydrogenase
VSIPPTTSIGERRIKRIGLGTNRLTDTSANHDFLERAVEAGLDFIDTAHLYSGGESERCIGAALAPFGDGLVVATKGGYEPGGGRPERLRAELEESFERLQTDTIPLYYLHRVDPDVPLEDSLGVLREYHDAGRIEHVGLSKVDVAQIERARSVVPIAAVQNEYNLGDRQYDDVIDFCEREGILFVPYYPLHAPSGGALGDVASRYGTTAEQIILAWLLKRSKAIVPIPGTLSLDHLNANLAALDIELSDEDFARLA